MSDGPKLEAEMWAGPMGDRWLAHHGQFEGMLASVGEAFIEACAFAPGETVVDVGCGAGDTSLQIARRVAPAGSVTGLDISEALVEASRRRAAEAGLANARFVTADAATARPEGTPFGRLCSRFGVMFFADPYAAFANMHGFLARDGRLDFACWAAPRDNGWMTTIQGVVSAYVSGPPPAPRSPGPFAFAEADYVRDILGRAGFRDVGLHLWQGEVFLGGPGADPAAAARFVVEATHVGEALAEHPESVRQEAIGRLREAFAPYHGNGGTALPSAVWFVSAKA